MTGSDYFQYETSHRALTTSTSKTSLGASSRRVQASAKLTNLTAATT